MTLLPEMQVPKPPASDAVLSYRHATTPPARSVDYVRALRDRHQIDQLRAAAKLALGLTLSFAPPALVLMIVNGMLGRFNVRVSLPPGAAYAICCVVTIPLLYLAERRRRDHFYLDVARDVADLKDTNTGRYSSRGAYDYATSLVAWAVILDVLLWPARLTLGGWSRWRACRRFAGIDFDRCASVLRTLDAFHTGTPVVELLHAGEQPADLVPALAFLAFHDWIGVGEKGRRVWILTEARQRLGVPAP